MAFILADMRAFELSRQFDMVLCLFSAIGYVLTVEKLNAAVSSMARHVSPGGILCIEPWFTPEQWSHRRPPFMTMAEADDFKVCRIFAGGQSGKISTNTLHYLVADGDKVDYFTERHDLGLFTEDEMRAAFEAVGFSVEFDPIGLENRGLYIGTKRSV